YGGNDYGSNEGDDGFYGQGTMDYQGYGPRSMDYGYRQGGMGPNSGLGGTGPYPGYGGQYGAGHEQGMTEAGHASGYGPYSTDWAQTGRMAGFGHHEDADYHHWRSQQMGKFDKDYADYRNERRKKFNEDFEKWRASRESGNESSAGSSTQSA